MSIVLLLAGFNRSLSRTWPAIQNKIIEPFEKAGIEVQVCGAISRSQQRIENVWSGENGYAEWEVPEPDRFHTLKYFEQEEIDIEINELFEAAMVNGNAWTHIDTSFNTLKNLIRFLYVLKKGYELIPREAASLFYMRPDILPFYPMDPLKYFDISENKFVTEKYHGVTLPNWQYWGGCNDLLAVISRPYWKTYLARYDQVAPYVAEGHRLHSESFLKLCIEKAPMHVIMDEKFGRIRLDGSMDPHDFETLQKESR